ncbi:MAG: hypothetical protein JWO42_1593 [Chloroflexi bacterium]|jgi:hypothetical protein|nr:hypothetical protein [Chloroflexota bacterium]
MEQQADKGHEVQADERLGQAFVVLGPPAEARSPGEAAFDHPPVRQEDEAALGLGQLDDFEGDALLLGGFGHVLAGVAQVQKGHVDVVAAHRLNPLRQGCHLGALLLVGLRHRHPQQVALRIDRGVVSEPFLCLWPSWPARPPLSGVDYSVRPTKITDVGWAARPCFLGCADLCFRNGRSRYRGTGRGTRVSLQTVPVYWDD